MLQPLVPARPAYQEGTPYSEVFGDVYHSAAGGLAQANHVFLSGNQLPERWAGRETFVVLETGFGLGINFLAPRSATLPEAAFRFGRKTSVLAFRFERSIKKLSRIRDRSGRAGSVLADA